MRFITLTAEKREDETTNNQIIFHFWVLNTPSFSIVPIDNYS